VALLIGREFVGYCGGFVNAFNEASPDKPFSNTKSMKDTKERGKQHGWTGWTGWAGSKNQAPGTVLTALGQALTVMVDAGREQREGGGRWLFGGVRTRISRFHFLSCLSCLSASLSKFVLFVSFVVLGFQSCSSCPSMFIFTSLFYVFRFH
jgi:hypothetical protein